MSQPPIASTLDELRHWRAAAAGPRRRVGLVPTMGALHEGHLSLARRCREECDATVVTIFVNPAQFGPGEDFERYPRTLEEDCRQLAACGVDLVFAPAASELYGQGFSTYVEPPEVARRWEGELRPGHFRGVATIVLKLFQLVEPAVAYFGQKDFQQCLVVRHMARDLNVPVEVQVLPTIRDPDGLAMSSRNRYLTDLQRRAALSLYAALQFARTSVLDGEQDGRLLATEMTQRMIDAGMTRVEYAALCDPETLQPLEAVRRPCVVLVAASIGGTRLIDNLWID